MFQLSEIQRDALMEVFNIGVGRASRSLALMLGCEASLSAPVIVQTSASEAMRIIDPDLKRQSDVCVVSRTLGGVDAEAVMIFQGSRGNLCSLMEPPVDTGSPAQDSGENIATRLAQLVSDSCAAQLEDLLGRPIERGKPCFMSSVSQDVFETRNQPDDVLFIVKIDILLKKRGVTGHLLVSFTREAANGIADGLDRLVRDEE